MNRPRKQHEKDEKRERREEALETEPLADADAAPEGAEVGAEAGAPAGAAAAAEAPEAERAEAEQPAPQDGPTPEEALAAERDELREKWLRALADLDNLRKRSRREVLDARRFAQAEVLRPLLDIADNFDRALRSMADGEQASADGVRQGVEMIHQAFTAVLRDRGVERIEAAGAEFDPAVHEAVAQVPSEDHEPGVVIEVVQEGYRLGDLVLRPARVVIAS